MTVSERLPRPLIAMLTFMLLGPFARANAQKLPSPQASRPDRVLAFAVVGTTSAGAFRVFVAHGPVVARALGVKSLPSGTLIGALANTEWAATEVGQQWLNEHLAGRHTALIDTANPEGWQDVTIATPDPADTHIQVTVNGDFPSIENGPTKPEVRTASFVKVGSVTEFAFSKYLAAPTTPASLDEYDCCGTGQCGSCLNCPAPKPPAVFEFTCCLDQAFGCGNCGFSQIYCGECICPICS